MVTKVKRKRRERKQIEKEMEERNWLEREEKNEILKPTKPTTKREKIKLFTKNQKKRRNVNIETCKTSTIYKTCQKI
jgi:hypothetical protein